MEQGSLFPTEQGTPQGGVISPLLANIALHGMETVINQQFPARSKMTKGKRTWVAKAQLIRYADDLVILHEDQSVIEASRAIIANWLVPMGLELKPSKTRLAHTLHEVDGAAGFDFLGFTVRQFAKGKHRGGFSGKGVPLGFKTFIKPSKSSVQRHYDRLAEIVDAHRSKPQAELIDALNPVIRGWTNYHCRVVSKRIFVGLGHLLYQKLRAWGHRRHPTKAKGWTAHKYWTIIKGKGWWFATRQGQQVMRLVRHADVPIVRHVKPGRRGGAGEPESV